MKSLLRVCFTLLCFTLLSVVSNAQNCCPQITNGLLAYYSFCGNANDMSGNGRNGTVHGATLTADRFGNSNSAYSFNGTTAYISVADAAPLRLVNTDYTISAWIYETSYATSQDAIITKRTTSAQQGYILNVQGTSQLVTRRINYQVAGGSDPRVFSTDTVYLNTWTNVLVTYTASSHTALIYMNGVLTGMATNILSPLTTTAALWIGGDVSGSPYGFHGKIDDVAFFNRVLSPAEILQMQGDNAACPCLIASYLFTGNTADSSDHQYNGINHGATLTTDRYGMPNKAYHFNGGSNYISIADTADLRLNNTDFTISAWFLLDSLSTTNKAILTKRTTAAFSGYILNVEGSLQPSPGKLNFQVAGGSDPRVFSSTIVPIGSWQQVAVTYTNSNHTAKMYLNGTWNATGTGIQTPSGATTSALWIGGDVSGSPYYFEGKIDDVQIFTCAYSDSEIAQLYHDQTVGVSVPVSTATFTILKNPVKDFLQIQMPEELSVDRSFRIYDLIGKVVITDVINMDRNSSTVTLNVKNLSPGIYLLQLNSDKGSITRKFVKE
jgi:hypothetical protein